MSTGTLPDEATTFCGGQIARCAAALEALQETFQRPFEVWMPGEPWRLCEFLSPIHLHGEDDEYAERCVKLCQSVAASGTTQTRVFRRDQQLLGIPIFDHDRVEAVALSAFAAAPVDLLLALATAHERRMAQVGKMEKLCEENESFVLQVTQDFEELMFLRATAEQLELSDLREGLAGIAGRVLPLLNESVKADWLALLRADDAAGEEQVLFAVGEMPVALDVCTGIINIFQDHAAIQPVVRNGVHKSEERDTFPGVRNIALVPLVVNEQSHGWLLALNRQGAHHADVEHWQLGYHEFGTHEASLMATAASIMGTQASNIGLLREKEELLVSVVRAMVSAIEAKDEYTRGHSERVALYGRCLAVQLGYTPEQADRLYLTGLLHDVGKIGVSDATLKKPGRLTDEEFEEIKRHPDEGWSILQGLQPLSYVLPGVLQHHERVDGKGYPDGLVGKQISKDGRILSVADAYDAMTSDRAYRKGMPTEKAESILLEGAGTQWDATVIEAFFAVLDQMNDIRESYAPRPRAKRMAQDSPQQDCLMSQVKDDRGEILTWS